MLNGISFNVQRRNNQEVLNYLQGGKYSVVAFNDEKLAAELASWGMDVIYRRYNSHYGYDSDDNVHKKVSPDIFVMSVQDVIDTGYTVYVNNEPSTVPEETEHLVDWLYDVGMRIVAQGGRAVLGNIAIGHPEPDDLWMWEKLINLIRAHPDQLALGVHEGGFAHWMDWMEGPVLDEPETIDLSDDRQDYHLTGRFLRFFDMYGEFPIVVTEWAWSSGYDTLGQPINLIGPVWRDHFNRPDTAQYAFEQIVAAYETFYLPYDIPMLLFCGGEDSDEWIRFNFSRQPEIIRKLANYDVPVFNPPTEEVTSPPPHPSEFLESTVTKTDSGWVNVRLTPSLESTIVEQIHVGDKVLLGLPHTGATEPIHYYNGEDQYTWIPVVVRNRIGWAANLFEWGGDLIIISRQKYNRVLQLIQEGFNTFHDAKDAMERWGDGD